MVRAGWYWCGKCESTPSYIAMSGKPAQGMYYSPSATSRLGEAVTSAPVYRSLGRPSKGSPSEDEG
jgi:hypothetical protein